MDKQTQEESSSGHFNGQTPITKEAILTNYDVEPINTVGSSSFSNHDSSYTGTVKKSGSRWTSTSWKVNNAGKMEPQLPDTAQNKERTMTTSYGSKSTPEIDHFNGETSATKGTTLADYNVQPINTIGSSSHTTHDSICPGTVQESGSSRTSTSWNINNAGITEPQVPDMAQKEERTVAPSYGATPMPKIGRKSRLLHALEGLDARLSLLESQADRMESSMDEMKCVIENYAITTDDKLQQLENASREIRPHSTYCYQLAQSWVRICQDGQLDLYRSQLAQSQSQSNPSSDSPPDAPTPSPDTSPTCCLLLLQDSPNPPQAPPPQAPSLPTASTTSPLQI